jgi:hypothetical protein
VLAAIGEGREDDRAPGLATRLPPPVRERIAETMRNVATFEFLGADAVGNEHFNLDPALKTIRWYRARTSNGMRYLTLRVSGEGRLLGVIVED